MDYQYNSLNLLSGVDCAGISKVKYTYAADGTKLAVSGGGLGYDYRGSLIYKRDGNALTLESAAFSDGRIIKSTGGYEVNYFITDHLGSVRTIFDASGSVKEQNDYYPFGGRYAADANYQVATSNRFKYNGKELQTTSDVGFLDYGARMYDSKLGRTHSQDLLQEDYYGISSYAYCFNDPVRYVDMFGLYADDPVKTIDYGVVTVSPDKPNYNWFASWLRMMGSNMQDDKNNDEFKNRLNSFDVDKLSMLLNYQKGQKVLPKLDGFWETFGYYLFGRTYDGYQVDKNGRFTSLKIIAGTAPTPGSKGGSIFIKGAGKVARGVFHIQTKKMILNAAGKSNFVKIVGRNPNIEINKAGEIILKGVQKNGFAGKVYNTGLSAEDFF